MGEIADDCYTQGLSDYYDMSDEDRHDLDERWQVFREINERRAQWRRNQQRFPSVNNSDEPPSSFASRHPIIDAAIGGLILAAGFGGLLAYWIAIGSGLA